MFFVCNTYMYVVQMYIHNFCRDEDVKWGGSRLHGYNLYKTPSCFYKKSDEMSIWTKHKTYFKLVLVNVCLSSVKLFHFLF